MLLFWQLPETNISFSVDGDVMLIWGQRSGDVGLIWGQVVERCVSEQQVEVGQQSAHVGDRSSPIVKGGKLRDLLLKTDRRNIM